MCIIAIKPKNKKLQDKRVLKTCFNNNQDGGGYMFVNNNREVIIRKGYMKFDEFYKKLTEDFKKYNLHDKNLIMHFRIGTSGQSAEGCTHPFPITDDYKQLQSTETKTNVGICHNGIISAMNDRTALYSDTQLYIAHVITPLLRLHKNAYKYQDIQNSILITTKSKWSILDNNDEIFTIGDFITEDGYIYSNGTYRTRITYTPRYNYTNTYDYLNRKVKIHDYLYRGNEDLEEYDTPVHKVLWVGNNRYIMINKGNVFMGKGLAYTRVKQDDKYYYDKEYNVYIKEGNNIIKQGTEAVIYTDETFITRRDYPYLSV